MHDQIRKMTVAAFAATATAAAIAGCGGSGDTSAGQPSPVGGAVGTQKVAQAQLQKRGSAAQSGSAKGHALAQAKSALSRHKSGAHRRHQGAQHASPTKSGHKRRETLAHILTHNTAARRAFVLKSAPGVLKLLGFKHAVVRVDDRQATIVTVLIDANEACGHSSTTESKIRGGIKRAIHFVRRVHVLVGSQDYAGYAAANCKALALPNVSGKLVYSASGHTGDTTTPAFTVSASKWTVAYENDGSFMTMFLLKGDKYEPQYFTTQSPGTGKQTFKGRGTFKLRISAAGDWQIKVYD